MAKTWADHIIEFMQHLDLDESLLPEDILPLYPLKGENGGITGSIVEQFYRQYYSDQRTRRLIIGINPGRLGAGATGIPFSDTKRLNEFCRFNITEFHTHEPSSAFVYEMIDAYGNPEEFYRSFYITSVCPIGFVQRKAGGKALNYNYYDSKALSTAIEPYVVEKLREQIAFGADTSRAFCLGTGKNFKFLDALNARHGFFEQVIPLEHPRYIMQYKNKFKAEYIAKYLAEFNAP